MGMGMGMGMGRSRSHYGVLQLAMQEANNAQLRKSVANTDEEFKVKVCPPCYPLCFAVG